MKKTRLYKFYRRKLFIPLTGFLNEGITPHKLALTVAFGVFFGLVPILGATTIFCLLIAFILGLNKPAILLINIFVYPLQLLLYIPFIKAGEYIFGYALTSLTIERLWAMIQSDWIDTIKIIWFHNLLGVFAWLIIMLPVSLIIYYGVLPVFKRFVHSSITE